MIDVRAGRAMTFRGSTLVSPGTPRPERALLAEAAAAAPCVAFPVAEQQARWAPGAQSHPRPATAAAAGAPPSAAPHPAAPPQCVACFDSPAAGRVGGGHHRRRAVRCPHPGAQAPPCPASTAAPAPGRVVAAAARVTPRRRRSWCVARWCGALDWGGVTHQLGGGGTEGPPVGGALTCTSPPSPNSPPGSQPAPGRQQGRVSQLDEGGAGSGLEVAAARPPRTDSGTGLGKGCIVSKRSSMSA